MTRGVIGSAVRGAERHSFSFLVKWAAGRGFRILTSGLRVLPQFLIIGAQRCGTTSLYNYLVDHPQIEPAFVKETHFFDLNFERGPSWYRAFFPLAPVLSEGVGTSPPRPLRAGDAAQGSGRRPVSGESTPYYLFHPYAARRARATVPEAKLIVLLRDPVDRAYSHYHHEVSRRAEAAGFEEALEREAIVLPREAARLEGDEGIRSFAHMHHSYLSRGVYVDQLARWAQLFPREQMLVLKSEAFYKDPGQTVEQVAAFLGLERAVNGFPRETRYEKHNLADYPQMDTTIRERLRAYFAPHNERLYEFLGWDLGW